MTIENTCSSCMPTNVAQVRETFIKANGKKFDPLLKEINSEKSKIYVLTRAHVIHIEKISD